MLSMYKAKITLSVFSILGLPGLRQLKCPNVSLASMWSISKYWVRTTVRKRARSPFSIEMLYKKTSVYCRW
ncbi:Uncharacterised protein [Vibrio cholerae]|nr:Uncharacterised protein [Vibrio cholerae]